MVSGGSQQMPTWATRHRPVTELWRHPWWLFGIGLGLVLLSPLFGGAYLIVLVHVLPNEYSNILATHGDAFAALAQLLSIFLAFVGVYLAWRQVQEDRQKENRLWRAEQVRRMAETYRALVSAGQQLAVFNYPHHGEEKVDLDSLLSATAIEILPLVGDESSHDYDFRHKIEANLRKIRDRLSNARKFDDTVMGIAFDDIQPNAKEAHEAIIEWMNMIHYRAFNIDPDETKKEKIEPAPFYFWPTKPFDVV
jgi:hypothetical protein